MLTNDYLIKVGFVPFPTFTIGNNVTYDLGRGRFLSGSSIGTPNEMMFIEEVEEREKDGVIHKVVTDVISLHNYDYDGYLSEDRLKLFMQLKQQENEK
jgi:hypothetical protein